MRRISVFFLVSLFTLGALPLFAQENFTPGNVVRVVHLRIKPGRTTEFWADVRQNLKPIFEEYKKQGIIANYSFHTKATTNSENDWSIGYVLDYPNYAALDGLADRTDPITLKHYGSREARTAAGNRRLENATVVEAYLIRRVDPKPMTAAAAPR